MLNQSIELKKSGRTVGSEYVIIIKIISNKQSNPFEKKGKQQRFSLSISSPSYMYIAASHLDKRTLRTGNATRLISKSFVKKPVE